MRTALYRHFDADGQLLYVGITKCPDIRDAMHRSQSPWFSDSVDRRVEWFDSRSEAMLAEGKAIAHEAPAFNKTWIGKTRGAAIFIDAVGKDRLAEKLGVTHGAVRQAHWRDEIPASWGLVVALLCRDTEFSCPMSAFNWAKPGCTDSRCISEVMFDRATAAMSEASA